MPHHTPFIATVVGGLVLAFILGALANRLRLSPIVGYLLAGVVVGPFTPGFVADQGLATELAEMGVILLMFGVGLHFSYKDLLAVKNIAVPGAVGQIAVATLLGMALAWTFGWGMGGGLVFGLALAVASTVVLLRALEEHQLLDTRSGHIAVGWLIVEDLAMVLALVLLPVLAPFLGGAADAAPTSNTGGIAGSLALTLGKVVAFVALMLVVGRRLVPWVLARIAGTGSRELFTLAILAIALGIAFGAASLFGVSFALGAFFAGMVLNESDLSHKAAEDSLPLRDAFAVLFFVSVGMLFDPGVLIREPLPVLATFLVIVLGKSVAAYLIVRAFRYASDTALLISVSLAQIGEFSFILMSLGLSLGLLPETGRDLILAGAILSIIVNPFLFTLAARLRARHAASHQVDDTLPAIAATDHVVLVGFGRVGKRVADRLWKESAPFVVIEADLDRAGDLRGLGIAAVHGNAARTEVLKAAGIDTARHLLVAIPNGFEAGEIVAHARQARPDLRITARAHLDAEIDHLGRSGADHVVMGEQEIANIMLANIGVAPRLSTQAL